MSDESLPFKKKKIMILDEEEYMRLKQKQLTSYDNVMRTLTFLKDEMDTIILRENLTADQKLKLFQAAQQRFDQVKSSQSAQVPAENANVVVTKPTQVETSAAVPVADTAPVTVSKEVVEPKSDSESGEIGDVVNELKVNPRHQNKLNDLVKHLRKRPEVFGVANSGELMLNGKVVEGSNMSDLMRNLYHSNKRYNLTGNVEFMRALANAHTPMSYIANSKARSNMTLTPKKGHGFSRAHVPPGKPARILRVY